MTEKSSSNRIVKIRPSWELVGEDEKGNLFFEFTDEPKNYKPERIRTHFNEKIIKEMEARRKL